MEIYFYFKLKKLLDAKGISQKEFARMTGLREATVSEICNNTRTTINKKHLIIIMKALRITKLEDLIDLVVYEETERSKMLDDGENGNPFPRQ